MFLFILPKISFEYFKTMNSFFLWDIIRYVGMCQIPYFLIWASRRKCNCNPIEWEEKLEKKKRTVKIGRRGEREREKESNKRQKKDNVNIKEKERENIYVGKREKVENKDRLHMLISGDNRILTEDRYDT